MLSSITKSTKLQYSSNLKLWWKYCEEKHVDFYDVKIECLLDFLSKCFQTGSCYGTLNNHRSAISLISSNNNIGQNESVKRFFKGVFKLKPSFPRYNVTWNPSIVLDYLATLLPDNTVDLKMLSKKLVMLLALVTAQRIQTLSLIRVSNITIYNDKIVIIITDLIKTSGIGRAQPVIELPFFNQRPNICPAATLQAYIAATSAYRTNTQDKLILTHRKPYRPASSQTIGRWIKQVLQESGIDTTIFSAHSTRHATTSAASRAGVSVEMIRKAAGWSNQSAVFANFYNRPLISTS
jgi:integrase